MKIFTKRKNKANTWLKTVVPRIYKELDKTYKKKREKMIMHLLKDLNFQVMDRTGQKNRI